MQSTQSNTLINMIAMITLSVDTDFGRVMAAAAYLGALWLIMSKHGACNYENRKD